MRSFKGLRAIYLIILVALTVNIANSQSLPTANEIADEMGLGWNLGNTMEAIGGPTNWGNPLPTQQLMDSVKAAGFGTVRIPAAWDIYADQNTLEIDPDWMAHVKEVVDYCIDIDLYVVLNIHWDGGWLEHNVWPQYQDEVNRKQADYWGQIATVFRDYDERLLFASTNEPAINDQYGTYFGQERMDVLNSYHQTFIDTVRSTGGNNASRTLIVQGPRTDIELTYEVMTTMPTDHIEDRLMAEIHFYPYQFTLMTEDQDWGNVFYYWGQDNHSTTDTERNSTWGEEAFVDSVFDLMKSRFVDNDIPVILGEFGAMKRMHLTGDVLSRHIQSRRTYYEYVVAAAKQRGIIPFPWDTGYQGNNTFTIFDRHTGEIFDLGLLNAIRSGWGMEKLEGDTSLVQPPDESQALKILVSEKDFTWGQVELDVLRQDMTSYESITVRAYVNGETDYVSEGTTNYGWLSLNLVTMSPVDDEWIWREASLGDLTFNEWENYTVPISDDEEEEGALVPAVADNVTSFALQTYSEGYRGTIYVDWIVFNGKDGTADTVYNFEMLVPGGGGGNVEAVTTIPTDEVENDDEWKTATTTIYEPTSAQTRSPQVRPGTLRTAMSNGFVRANWVAQSSGPAQVSLKNLQGRTIFSRSFDATAGTNTLTIPANYSGMLIVEINQGNKRLINRVISY
ncbi:cellulase family glycosylhydrolase [Chitinispirillales bacterium ANBcel5]|uniref:cellulase family glycosylhydrolase n=1 Tax=Cellulosispirillum alkaliphilum TaxID=3039283 RepID=UPI002A593BF1|nr:cellulase family glycosylhydrolase [Chitinispirillales bacterium ANBcel5]